MADLAVSEDKVEWVGRILGVNVASGSGGASDAAAAMAAWQTERAAAKEALRAIARAIQQMKAPEGDAAVILVKAIAANLTEAPDRRGVSELQRYLASDPIVAEAEWPNGFGIEIKLREKLLPRLAALQQVL